MIDHVDGKRLVVCIDNEKYEASLDRWKIYQSIPDEEAERHNEIRVIDEEGEDYLDKGSSLRLTFTCFKANDSTILYL